MSINFATCDLCDAHKNDTDGDFRVLPPVFKDYGQRLKFAGPVATVKCFEDNTLVKAAVDSPGHGRVLVVDGGASLRRALVGATWARPPPRMAGPAWWWMAACAIRPSWPSAMWASARWA